MICPPSRTCLYYRPSDVTECATTWHNESDLNLLLDKSVYIRFDFKNTGLCLLCFREQGSSMSRCLA